MFSFLSKDNDDDTTPTMPGENNGSSGSANNATPNGSQLNNPASNISAVSVKLPDFWSHMPDAWFRRIESQFSLRNITVEETRYHHLMSVVTEEMARKVMHVLDNPGNTPYTTLKEALIKSYALNEEQKMKELLRDTELGDRKPSELFSHMQTVAGKSELYTDKFLLALWEERLPNQVTAILKINDSSKSTTETLDAADRIFDALQQPAVSAVSAQNQSTSSSSVSALHELQLRNQILEKEVESLKFRMNQNRFRGRSRSRSRNFNGSRSENSNQSSGLCWYHLKYKEKAHKCTPPCSFQSLN